MRVVLCSIIIINHVWKQSLPKNYFVFFFCSLLLLWFVLLRSIVFFSDFGWLNDCENCAICGVFWCTAYSMVWCLLRACVWMCVCVTLFLSAPTPRLKYDSDEQTSKNHTLSVLEHFWLFVRFFVLCLKICCVFAGDLIWFYCRILIWMCSG